MGSKSLRVILVVLMVCIAVLGSSALVTADNVSAPGSPSRSIVVFRDNVVGVAAQQALVARAGGQWVKPLPLINAAVVMASPASQGALKARAEVLRVDEDVTVHALGKPETTGKPPKPTPTPPAEQIDWGVDRIGAEQAWASSKGAGVNVAVVDTGIDLDHPDLKDNIKGGYNAINPRKSFNDDNGHGTHVAGTIAAVDNEIGVIGVAPGASLYGVKVLNSRGIGFTSDIIEGLEWCIEHDIQVVNMSLGTTVDVPSFHTAITAAYDDGIVLVAAAGNNGTTVEYPGAYSEVIAVSATDENDAIADFSSRGEDVELAAPGVAVQSTWLDGGYKAGSGTSMASPHVAGTAALVIAADTDITVEAVRTVLRTTADDLGTAGKDNAYGYGLVDADGAVLGTMP